VARREQGYSVTGPNVERDGYVAPVVALSAAITFATRLDAEGTVYVRDAKGEPYGHVERDEDGVLHVRARR
jgi:hypothetical protein